MEFDAKWDGVEEFTGGMQRTANALPGSIYQGVVETCSVIETRAKTHHLAGVTLTPHTHRLQSSVKSDVRTNGKTVVGRVGSPVVYAAIFEAENENDRIIRPKNAKFLHFFIAGKEIFARQVKMPYRPWLSNSLTDTQSQIETIFGHKIEIVIG